MPNDLVLGQIRPFRNEDAEALATVFYAAIHAVSRDDYDEAQLRAWAPEPPGPEGIRRRAADGRLLLVATDERDRPVAYGDLEADGHLDHLYRHPDAANRGVAAALYGRLEEGARSRGLRRLFVEASEPARRFFSKQGFSVVERRTFELRGVPIHNYAMEKRLSASGWTGREKDGSDGQT